MSIMEHNEIKEAIFEAFETITARNELKEFIKSELLKAINEDQWITIKPNGESGKGRHLLIKDGENVYDAMRRQWGIETAGQQHLFSKKKYETNDDYKKELYAKFEEQLKQVKEKEEAEKQKAFKEREEAIKKDATEMMLDKFLQKHLEHFDNSYSKAMDYWEKYYKDYHTKAINEFKERFKKSHMNI